MIKRNFKHLLTDDLDASSGRINKARWEPVINIAKELGITPGEVFSEHPVVIEAVIASLSKTRNLKPFDQFLPPKPANAIYDPSSKAVSDWFAHQTNKETRTVNVFVEPKYNGLRVILHYANNQLGVIYEDASTNRANDVLGADPQLNIWHKLPDCIIDGDLCVIQGGKRWSRAQMMTFLKENPQLPPGATLLYTAYDLLFWDGTAWNTAPFWRRQAALQQLAPTLMKYRIAVTRSQQVTSASDIAKLFGSPQFGNHDQSEGIIVKAGDWIYGVGGRDNVGMLKIKKSITVNALVVKTTKNQNSTFTMECVVAAGSYAGKLDNLVTINNQQYVQLGSAHNAQFQAQEGEVLTVRVEEIVYNDQLKILTWTGPTPIDVGKGSVSSADSVVQQAQHVGVYQETGQNIAKSDFTCSWKGCDHPAVYRLLWADGRAVQYACEAHRKDVENQLREQGEDDSSMKLSLIKDYRLLEKSDSSQRYTLGIAYPADEIDSHGDFASPEEVEKAAWNYLAKSRDVGLMHENGTDGAGIVVESYVYRGPDWTVENQVVKAGDWLLGVVWDEQTWSDIQDGKIQGYSIQGYSLSDG